MEAMSGELEDPEQRRLGERERERIYCVAEERSCVRHYKGLEYHLFVVLGLRCLLDCHVLKGFGIYMIGILDRL